jgi:hypothetical protein
MQFTIDQARSMVCKIGDAMHILRHCTQISAETRTKLLSHERYQDLKGSEFLITDDHIDFLMQTPGSVFMGVQDPFEIWEMTKKAILEQLMTQNLHWRFGNPRHDLLCFEVAGLEILGTIGIVNISHMSKREKDALQFKERKAGQFYYHCLMLYWNCYSQLLR